MPRGARSCTAQRPPYRLRRYRPAAAKPLAERHPVELKDPSQFRLIGKALPRLEVPLHVTPAGRVGCNMTIPACLWRRSPAAGLRCEGSTIQGRQRPGGSWRESGTPDRRRRRRRCRQRLVGPRGPQSARCFLGPRAERQALQRRDRAPVQAIGGATGRTGAKRRRCRRGIKGTATIVEAEYFTPYLAHATMEPMNCTAHVRADRCDVGWRPRRKPTPRKQRRAPRGCRPARSASIRRSSAAASAVG